VPTIFFARKKNGEVSPKRKFLYKELFGGPMFYSRLAAGQISQSQ